MRRRTTKLAFLAAVCTALVSSSLWPGELKTPAPPLARVEGTPGNRVVCYWVFAESNEPAPLDGAWYLKAFPNKVTDLSRPCVVKNAPETLDANNKIVLTLKPVDGAVKYHVFRTEEFVAPKLLITVKKPGNDSFYYWVQGHNGWRNSPLAGPYEVKCDANDFDNEIRVAPLSRCQWQHTIWVTKTPAPPAGRVFHVVGVRFPKGLDAYIPTLVQHHRKGWSAPRYDWFAAWGPGEPATAVDEPPTATGRYWIASTDKLTVEDVGQDANMTQAPSVNETLMQDFADRLRKPQSSRFVHQGNIVSAQFRGETSMGNNFYGGYTPLELSVNVQSGGKNYYQPQPAAYPGYKSTIGVANFALTSYTQSQQVTSDISLHTYGEGDAIVEGLTGEWHGGIRDGGDEGGQLVRSFVTRVLDENLTVMTADAPAGASTLKVEHAAGGATGRIVVNLSQAAGPGRIDHVENCDIFGEGTDWKPEIAGHFISFDIDIVPSKSVVADANFKPPLERTTLKRSWFQVVEVVGPTHLRVMMPTNWRRDMNFGYNRFIYNPAKGKLPSLAAVGQTYGAADDEPNNLRKLYTSHNVIGVLPKELEPAAAEGKYLLAPGTCLADPWNKNGGLYVEPLAESWKAGDRVAVTVGTCQPIIHWWGWHSGELGPNDYIEGICMRNQMQRTINGAAFYSAGFGLGMIVDLPKDRQGNGVIVNGQPVDGAFLAAPDIPIVRCYNSAIPYVQGSRDRTALEVVAPSGEVPLSVAKSTVAIGGSLKGSDRIRGKASLSGDGKTASFTVKFPASHDQPPYVVASSNLPIGMGVVEVTADGFRVVFASAPAAGQNNVVVTWMVME